MVGLIRSVSEGFGPAGAPLNDSYRQRLTLSGDGRISSNRRFTPGYYLIAGSVLFVSYEICLGAAVRYGGYAFTGD